MNTLLSVVFGLLIVSTFVIRGFAGPSVSPGAGLGSTVAPPTSLSSSPTTNSSVSAPTLGSTTKRTPQRLRVVGVDVEDDD